MTKYILSGGNDLHSHDYGKRLAREVYETVEQRPVQVLSCFFATPSEYRGKAAETWQPWFDRSFGKNIVWSTALPEQFIEQIHRADVGYLHGGDNDLLFHELAGYPQLREVFTNKVVIGSSAGANYLSKHFWVRGRQEIRPGAGILPCSVMVHYGADEAGAPKTDWEDVERRLTRLEGEKLLKIREGHFWVVEDEHHGD